jgi:capsular exopolysaccharide synthesis family protein
MRYAEERIKSHIPKTTVEQVAPGKAASADDPVRPRPLLNMVLSLIVGIGAGIGLAYFVEYLDTSVKTIEDIESLMKVSVLGVIPQKVKPFVDPSAEAAHKEAYRVLRTNIRLSKKLASGKALCVTSGSVGEGKSLTVFNLAYCFAEMGDRTLVIDSDLHRPRQHRILGIGNRPGLANYLVGETPLDDVIRDTKVPNLHMIPSGKLQSGVHGLLASEKMQALVALLKERYDIVLLDSPPIIGVSDASLLVRYVDGVLLVIQHRKYPRAVSSRAKDMVVNVGANLLGVVLNNINVSKDYTYYYYQQHYYYYPRRPGREDKETA